MNELKLESAFEVIAKKFNTRPLTVGLAYATGNANVVAMVNKMTGVK